MVEAEVSGDSFAIVEGTVETATVQSVLLEPEGWNLHGWLWERNH